ncbi:NADAR family protein [Pseudoxanthomonas mexicana]|uniref:NADAR family protein n=1 Tax=Pseudoxanthomonas mexicana TaxID=128785 RepID=A0ABX6RAN7_PSEMX|nr:NADAR family protein [Pseudoxanthomonas mexicana]QND79576.1 NADAR family protein [Pseudoxanthomonas mexicana]
MKKTAATQKPAKSIRPADIPFYRANEKPYGAFSNLFRREMEFEGRLYPTAEHAYQAGKARKEEVREWILSAPTPSLVAMAAHGLYTWDIVPDWSRTKFARMRSVLLAKFTQHEDLKQLLLSTGRARLVEAGRTDNAVNRTWGEVNGKGQNMLGVLLMEVRDELQLQGSSSPKASAKKAKQSAGVAARVAIAAAA